MAMPDQCVKGERSAATADRVNLPTVSVVVPCLNRVKYIAMTLDSILAQDYPNLECVVMDGGSTDGTVELVKKEYGDRVRLVSQPDDGHADAINKGWWRSTGEVLAWLNADDVWMPGAVGRAVEFLLEHADVDVVYGDCGAITEQGELCGYAYHHEWDLRYAVEHCDHCIPQPAAFFRRRILEAVGWLDVGFVQKKDHELWLRVGRKGTIRHIPELLAGAMAVPGYMGYRGDFTAATCVQITEKFFHDVENQALFGDVHRRAMSNSFLKGATYAWNEGFHWRVALDYAMRAMDVDASNARRVLARLKHQFARDELLIRFVEQIDRTAGTLGLFGFTELAKKLVIEFGDRGVAYIVDNDPAKQGARFNGIEVVSFEYAREHPPDVIAVTSVTSLGEIRRQLEAHPEFNDSDIITARSTGDVDLSGDRDVEYSWIAATMPPGPGRALDFGCGFGYLGLLAAQRGYAVTALDLRDVSWPYEHARLEFVRGDVLDLEGPPEGYDLVINCSSVEHVGLAGRYGSGERPDGDLDAMRRLLRLTRPGGRMLLTIPVGRDAVFKPQHRVYGRERLPRLLDGWDVAEAQFWLKDQTNRWRPAAEDDALDSEPTDAVYGLGCFVLGRPPRHSDICDKETE